MATSQRFILLLLERKTGNWLYITLILNPYFVSIRAFSISFSNIHSSVLDAFIRQYVLIFIRVCYDRSLNTSARGSG